MKKYWFALNDFPGRLQSSLDAYLYDKPWDRVRILLARQESEDIPDDLHEDTNCHGAEIPSAETKEKP